MLEHFASVDFIPESKQSGTVAAGELVSQTTSGGSSKVKIYPV